MTEGTLNQIDRTSHNVITGMQKRPLVTQEPETSSTYRMGVQGTATYFLPEADPPEMDTLRGSAAATRKRTQRPSPLPSPMKVASSPARKLHRRLRTGTEQNPTNSHANVVSIGRLFG